MNIKVFYYNGGRCFDISSLAGDIQYTTDLNYQPGKLTFSLMSDPSCAFRPENGGTVALRANTKDIFYGYIFSISTDESQKSKITAYDQMRYLKNQGTLVLSNMTASQGFARICAEAGINYGVLAHSSYVLPDYYYRHTALYTIIEDMITKANVAENKQFFIRDIFGVLVFTEMERHRQGICIGDESLMTGYQFDKSIDKETYNVVKLVLENDESADVWIEYDSASMAKWGKLQLTQKAGKDSNEAQNRKLAADLLKLHNKETKTMKLNICGAPNANCLELVAGSGFLLKVSDLRLSEWIWIKSAVHSFDYDFHTVSLEVYI